MALDAHDAADRVGQLIMLTERLTGLIADQALAFERRRPQDAAAHLEETSRLANLYRHESARVRAQPALIAGASLEQRRALMRATEGFDAVLARQGRALEAAKTVTEGLVKAIAEEVVNQRSAGPGYGPGATPLAADGRAIALNRSA
ncbi:MAG: flagellar basal body protein [Caulobacteraceae bacterium]|nr:flagellar basal body protein [Caulobacter sp.]RYF92485.1 MAG: flagellar basal body protein [Caulobacteraceae bacterium]